MRIETVRKQLIDADSEQAVRYLNLSDGIVRKYKNELNIIQLGANTVGVDTGMYIRNGLAIPNEELVSDIQIPITDATYGVYMKLVMSRPEDVQILISATDISQDTDLFENIIGGEAVVLIGGVVVSNGVITSTSNVQLYSSGAQNIDASQITTGSLPTSRVNHLDGVNDTYAEITTNTPNSATQKRAYLRVGIDGSITSILTNDAGALDREIFGVNPSGQVTAYANATAENHLVRLGQVSNSIADTGWILLTGASGITSTTYYRKVGKVVFLRGSFTGATNLTSGTTLGTLPTGYRPSGQLAYIVPGTGVTYGKVLVGTNGVISLSSAGTVTTFINVDVISFPV